jgi:hypothetical protein
MPSSPAFRLATALFASCLSSSLVSAAAASVWLPTPDSLSARQTASTFQLAATGTLAGLGLTSACEAVLYQSINCVPYVKSLGLKVYHRSPGDKAFTDTVCPATCSAALATARRRITGSCATTPNLFPGYPVIALIDSVTSGWNETCLKDTDGGYCNGKIP